jgi:hypothetical protein
MTVTAIFGAGSGRTCKAHGAFGSATVPVPGAPLGANGIDEAGRRPGTHQRCLKPPSQTLTLKIRHWEVTARVQKAFLSFFSICFWICLVFFDLFADLARACLGSWSVRRGRARSCEYVWIAQSDSGLIRRETSRARPDLAADSGCRRVRRARGRL